ncbi:MAG: DUF1287 domain-containing protein [Armatimonadetes bacterium]|nr:DUF1287 domain-containing protein [Armatimonadota bacterium]
MRTLLAGVALLAAGCGSPPFHRSTTEVVKARIERSPNKVFQGALVQLVKPARYDDRYYSLSYPNGDVAADRGACADVVVRALRYAGYDLQKLIHDDSGRFKYPRIQERDTNIDHRRVLNQEVFFKRHGKVLTTKTDAASLAKWKPGDIVSWQLTAGTHIGIVSDTMGPDGVPCVIHNMGQTAEEDVLTNWPIRGHYRYP